MRRTPSVVLALVLALTAASVSARPALVAPTPAALLDRVQRLAAPEMEGRASGTSGNEAAAQYLADALAAAGLRPGGDGGTFFQSFVIGAAVKLSPAATLTSWILIYLTSLLGYAGQVTQEAEQATALLEPVRSRPSASRAAAKAA